MCAAAGFACARRRDGTAWCWGDNRRGQLGRAERAMGLVAAPVPDLHGVAEVACSDEHACARLHDGTVWCWGAVAFGERGYVPNDRTRIDPPMRVPRVRDSVRVMISDRFTFSIDRSGGVQRWPSYDVSNLLGGGAVLASYRGITPLRFIHKVHEYGPDHGTAFWVGRDGSLQGGPLDSPRLEPLSGVTMLASHGRWTDQFQLCALRTDGSLWCRDVVLPLFEPQPEFRRVDGVADAVDLAGGARHLCYASRDGGVFCRGDNALGQVDGTRLPRTGFVPLRDLPPPGDAIDVGPDSTPTAFRCPPGDRVVYVEVATTLSATAPATGPRPSRSTATSPTAPATVGSP
nr:hypothetical protein [Deltaproteobacteria bacterium]